MPPFPFDVLKEIATAILPTESDIVVGNRVIRTTKRVQSLTPGSVMFTDGSLYYPGTGKLINNGPGEIKVLGS